MYINLYIKTSVKGSRLSLRGLMITHYRNTEMWDRMKKGIVLSNGWRQRFTERKDTASISGSSPIIVGSSRFKGSREKL
jgi:hypothetical protein